MWDLIVSVPDYCLSFYSTPSLVLDSHHIFLTLWKPPFLAAIRLLREPGLTTGTKLALPHAHL